MLTETHAIILHKQDFKENEAILTTYCEELGRVNFILYGANSKRAGKRQSYLQPLSLVVIIADVRPNRPFQVVKSIRSDVPLTHLLSDPYKSTTALFIAEFLMHSLRTSERDKGLFLFLKESILWLELCDTGSVCNLHIAFLTRLSVFMGFTPNLGPVVHHFEYFDLSQSEYIRYARSGGETIDSGQQTFLRSLLRINYRNMGLFHFSRTERNELIDRIVRYYQLQIQGFGELRTLDILHTVFDF